MANLSELIATKTKDQLVSEILIKLGAKGYSATDWKSGSESRTLVEVEAETLSDLWLVEQQTAKGGYLDTAEDDWLTLLAASQYQIDRTPSEFTKGLLTVSVAAGTGPYTFNAGDIIAGATVSNVTYLFRNTNAAPVTINPNTSASIEITAESPGKAYNVAAGTINRNLTPKPGVSINNPGVAAPAVVTSAYIGTGPFTTVGLSLKLVLTENGAVLAPVTLTFASNYLALTGAGSLVTALNNTLIAASAYSGKLTATGVGGQLVLTSTLSGDTQAITVDHTSSACLALGFSNTFDTIGNGTLTWLTQNGRDQESDDSLVARCKAKWGILGAGTRDAYLYWAKTASALVQKAVVFSNYLNGVPKAGAVTLYICGVNTAADQTTINAVNAYIQPKIPIMTELFVGSARMVTWTINPINVIIRSAFNTTEAKNTILNNINLYIQTLQIGDPGYISKVICAIVDSPGVVDATTAQGNLTVQKNELISQVTPTIVYTVIP